MRFLETHRDVVYVHIPECISALSHPSQGRGRHGGTHRHWL